MAETSPEVEAEQIDPSLLLALGKLGGPLPEVMVLEANSPQCSGWRAQVDPACESSPPGRPVVEDDLALEDYGSDDEAREWQKAIALQFPPPLQPGSAASIQRMDARAKQCVVCFAEKPHTLVPAHALSGPQIASHRFCTDCWAEYLLYSLKTGLAPTCPVCRRPIDVPDAWYVTLGLPDHWCRGSRAGARKEVMITSGSSWCQSSLSPPPAFWADISRDSPLPSRRRRTRGEGCVDESAGDFFRGLRQSLEQCVERLHCMIRGGSPGEAI